MNALPKRFGACVLIVTALSLGHSSVFSSMSRTHPHRVSTVGLQSTNRAPLLLRLVGDQPHGYDRWPKSARPVRSVALQSSLLPANAVSPDPSALAVAITASVLISLAIVRLLSRPRDQKPLVPATKATKASPIATAALVRKSRPRDPTISYSKPSKESRETVPQFLSRRFPYHTPERWADLIENGSVFVNGVASSQDQVLDTNDQVSYRSVGEEPSVDRRYAVLHDDADLLIVSKSGGIPVTESGRYYRNVLVRVVEEEETARTGRPTTLYTVHRLDRETSGTVILCRHLQACQHVSAQFETNTIEKIYYAVLVGDLLEVVDCRLPILKLGAVQPLPDDGLPQVHRLRMLCHPDGQSSHTRFTPVQRAGGLTLCRIRLFTGRTHQIRVHAFALGFPLLGDKLYGQSDQAFMDLTVGTVPPEFPPFGLVPRHLLHAADIALMHPTTGLPLRITSDPAVAFQDCPYVTAHLFADPMTADSGFRQQSTVSL